MKSLRKIIIGTLVLLCCTTYLIQAQNNTLATVKLDSLYFESPALFECKVLFPKGYTIEKPSPLIISLHGGGGSYERFKNIWRHFENPQFIMATPQAPYKWLMGDKIGYDWSAWPTGDLIVIQKALKLASTYIENLILTLKENYNISEVYLMGFSQGSIITQIAGINNRELLNGLIICSGPPLYELGQSPWTDSFEIGWPLEETVQSANYLRVFIAHGKSDENIDLELANKSREQYKKWGYDVTFFEFEGGHEINAEAMKEIEKWINKEK